MGADDLINDCLRVLYMHVHEMDTEFSQLVDRPCQPFIGDSIASAACGIYPYYTRRGGIVVVLHIYGARAIFLIFCVNQDTEKE